MISIQNVLLTLLLASASITSAVPIFIEDSDLVDISAREGLSCYPLTVDQVKKLPGWRKVEQYARDNWGEKYGLNMNPPEYSERGANACVNVAKVDVHWNQKPQCSDSRMNIDGKTSGTTSSITFTQRTGSEQSASWTVTKASDITASVSLNVEVGVPGMFTAGMSASTSTSIRNERSSSFTTSSNDMKETTLTYQNDSGKRCKMELITKTCSATASGRVPVIATGNVWFYYDKAVPRKGGAANDKHYHWTVKLERILSEAERTSYTEFQGPVKGVSKAVYDVNCKNQAKPKPKPKTAKANAKGGNGKSQSKGKQGKQAPRQQQ